MNVYHAVSELFNEVLRIYFDKYCDFSDARRKKVDTKYIPDNLMSDTYHYKNRFEKEVEKSAYKTLKGNKNESFDYTNHGTTIR